MQKVLSAEEMREVDRLTTEKYNIPSMILMENAAHAVAEAIKGKLGGTVVGKSFLVLCGKGNNGGDGAALARILWQQGAKVSVCLFGKVAETKGDARTNFEILKKLTSELPSKGLEFREVSAPHSFEVADWKQKNVVVDALFGTGLNKPLSKELGEFLSGLSKHENRPLFVSIDIPSGLNADLPLLIGENFNADLTVTFTAPKLANIFPPASRFNGELVVADIGSPQELIDNSASKLFLAEIQDAQKWLEKTKVQTDSYKRTRGTALIIAGSEDFSGAAVLAANACFASGAGMVSLVVPEAIKAIAASKTSDEIIVKTFENTDLTNEKADVIALGCGLPNDEKTRQFICETVKKRKAPMVLDAEALNALSPFYLQGSEEFPLILTPHIGEFRRLLGREVSENKVEEARRFAEKHKVILVLKGERSLISAPDGTVIINPTGNAGISRAGAGDTLTGIITAFLAQVFGREKPNFENIREAVVAALYIAGLAGDKAAEKFSERLMTATDVRNCLLEIIRLISDFKK
jgi:NAD(P)H-hydrate epimerase